MTEYGFVKQFMLTYRSLTWNGKKLNGLDLIDLLSLRITSALPVELQVVHFRTANLLNRWVKEFYFDFVIDCPALGQACQEFVSKFSEGNPINFLTPKIILATSMSSSMKEKETSLEPYLFQVPEEIGEDYMSFFGNASFFSFSGVEVIKIPEIFRGDFFVQPTPIDSLDGK
eukprot:TRINITY_DN16570_c0_g2_i2.p1 TRINITY_DN16570_c0_g2~~TRINITY_DN16570_c0_g2_i2.p1  ORF type:complete len:172 (-),score=27.04 TRINITY_DN16570_c0_g2_i2:63-578(-)